MELHVVNHLNPPFELGNRAFDTTWWLEAADALNKDRHQYISFRQNSIEVARAAMTTTTLGLNYLDLKEPFDVMEIVLFEVHSELRRTGTGCSSIRLLEEHYAGQPLAAFSHDADHFWSAIGWQPYPKIKTDMSSALLFLQNRVHC